MNNIHFISPNDSAEKNYFINSVYRLRNDSFKVRLGWDVSSDNGLEKDDFDKLDVFHIAMTDKNDHVVGCWRALPTKGPYMLRNVFPQLLRGEEFPEQPDVWEISRFTIDKNFGAGSDKLVSDSTARLVKSFYDFAQHKAIKAYVLVTTVACERILRCLGVKTRRMGDGETMQIGIERSVALWLDVDGIKIA